MTIMPFSRSSSSSSSHRRMPFTTLCLMVFLQLLQGAASSSLSSTSATFELYDNGASAGGVTVTLEAKDFPIDDEGHAGEHFAILMSHHVNVTKYGKQPGTVMATKAFREDGEKIISFDQLLPAAATTTPTTEGDHQRRIYLVAEGLEFVWPFIEYGHRQTVSTRALTPVDPDIPVVIESMSDSPRVFKIYHLFSQDESDALIATALEQKLKRSTVGNSKQKDGGAHSDHGRTSENAWDSVSPAAKQMISRSFNLTGVKEDAGQIDGLQVVRYLPGQFYNSHPDYFEQNVDAEFDFYPYSGGSNRFATVFMYINDVEEGGNTVFPEVPSPNPTKPQDYELEMFDEGSLEYNMLFKCHNRLAVEPQQGTAALFYSITPDGRVDKRSLHGACPVIKGVKWGANIWIWNRQRFGHIRSGEKRALSITNTLTTEDIYITWEGKDNGHLPPGATYSLNTYEFHRFKAHTGSHKEKSFDEFTVQSEPHSQHWDVKPARRFGNDSPSQVKEFMASRGILSEDEEEEEEL